MPGRLVESGPAAAMSIITRGIPYTMALLRSVPRLDRPRQERLDPVEGQPPDLTRLDGGCAFRPRCRFAVEACAVAQPPLSRPALRAIWPPASAADDSSARPEPPHERAVGRAAARGEGACGCISRSPRASSPPAGRRGEGGRRHRLHRAPRRNARPGRRERLRQDHDRPLHPAAGTADRRRDHV